jgi:hypothetical protein
MGSRSGNPYWTQGRPNAEQQWQNASNMMLERALQSLSPLLKLKDYLCRRRRLSSFRFGENIAK